MQRLKIFGSIFIILTVIIINITIESNAEGGINVSIKVNGNGCFENGIEYRSEGNICVDVSSDIGISNGVISITQNGDKKEYTYNYEECPEKISETLNVKEDGEYIIEANFENADGNSACDDCYVYVDSTDPCIDEIKSEGGLSLTGSGLADLCFDEGVTINIYSHDNETGVVRVEYSLINDNSVVEEGSLEAVRETDGRYVSSLCIQNSFTGILCVNAIDKLNNNSGDNSTCVFSVGDKNENEDENKDENEDENKGENEITLETENEETQEGDTDEKKVINKGASNKEISNKGNDANRTDKSKNEADNNVIKQEKKSKKKKNDYDAVPEKKSEESVEKQSKNKSDKIRSPVIEIKGIKNGRIYGNNVSFSILIKDENLKKQDVIISLTKNQGEKIYLTDIYREDNKMICNYDSGNNSYFLIPDGEYNLKIKIYDSKYRILLKEINKTFSINLGSEYFVNDECKESLGKYLNKPVDIAINEINIDNNLEDTVVLKLTKNGVTDVLKKNKDYSIAKVKAGEKTKYIYKISDNVFNEDGIYSFVAESIDNAGNKNKSFDGKNGIDIYYGVDRISPEVNGINLKSNLIINDEKYIAKIVIHDNIDIANVDIRVNGDICPYENQGDNYIINLNENNDFQNVEITAKDKAGNEKKVCCKNIIVSTNIWIRIVYRFLKIIGYIMVIFGMTGLIYRFSKNNTENCIYDRIHDTKKNV